MAYSLEDFRMDLRKTLTPPSGIWAASGFSVCSPHMGTVVGVQGCFSPPFAAPDIAFGIQFTANGHTVPDNGSKGKDDCGLLYSGGDWLPDKIVRRGTYHFNVGGKLISFEVLSELTPLFGCAGFAVKLSVNNRTKETLKISAEPLLSAGHPRMVSLADWEFSPPKASDDEARQINENIWENAHTRITMLREEQISAINEGETQIFRYALLLTKPGVEPSITNIAAITEKTKNRWQGLVELASDKLPKLNSDIPGLEAYYNRSVLSGLVSLWENESFITNPFPVTSGVDGGSICCYPWDVAGYSARMLVMLLGERSLDFFKALLGSGIDRHISMALDGSGLGWCPYSYSMWSLLNLYIAILTYCDKGYELFDEILRIFENEEERLPEWDHLKDYGRQHNLLEMRSCGYEYFVASPNAERAWCYDQLADIGQKLGRDLRSWRKKADLIRDSIRRNLWDKNLGWFKCLHPDGHTETVYSIQIYDTMKCGACDSAMKEELLKHLRDGAFLGKYGVSGISAEDTIHYELNDPDWSGGGCYSGDGPELAELLWNEGKPRIAWDVLGRHFWMGQHLLYYPQEHYCDIPQIPHNKRANIIAGVTGMQSVLFGMAGIRPSLNGHVEINPNPPDEGFVEIIGYKIREKTIDIIMRHNYVKITVNGSAIYEGEPKTVKF